MALRDVAYSLYERRLLDGLDADDPRRVGVILDGNRRSPSQGETVHRAPRH